ncbi:hypothetical protein [Roseibium sp. M-1]
MTENIDYRSIARCAMGHLLPVALRWDWHECRITTRRERLKPERQCPDGSAVNADPCRFTGRTLPLRAVLDCHVRGQKGGI